MSSYSHLCNPAAVVSSSLMESTVWTCTVCSLTIPVDDGPSHLASNDHIAHLSDFTAAALASRLEELITLLNNISGEQLTYSSIPPGIQAPEYLSAEKGTPLRISSYSGSTSSESHTEVKSAHMTPGVFSSTGGPFWVCEVCDRMMLQGSKSDHLAGKAHAKTLKSKSSVLSDYSHDIPAKSVTPTKKTWTCPSCKAVLAIQEKRHHHCSSSEPKLSALEGPLDEFFRFYPSFFYDPSVPPATSFKLLRTHQQRQYRWAHKSIEDDELWRSYQAALTQEFNLWFGIEDDLNAWQSLCRAVRISPLPTTIALCRSVGHPRYPMSRGTYANVRIRPFTVAMST